jgi:hypothetical protein
MSNLASVPKDHAEAVEYETYELVPTWRLSELLSNFARVHILVTLFDGDPDKWLDFIRRDGTADEREFDLPFIEKLKARLADDPNLLGAMRHAVRDVSALFIPRIA